MSLPTYRIICNIQFHNPLTVVIHQNCNSFDYDVIRM
ncbi:ankyrin-like protein [Vaccinia virus]|nr:ankyrin-like protein [Vaccinia virus]